MRRVEDFIGNLEEKAAAKVRGQIWDGPIAQNDPYVMNDFLTVYQISCFYASRTWSERFMLNQSALLAQMYNRIQNGSASEDCL